VTTKPLILATTALALVAGPVHTALAQGKTIKIGFVSTFSGPGAAIGNDMRNSFELGLDHLGRKLGGLPVEVVYEDDEIKPDVGVQKADRIRPRRFHRRLHLVERAARLA
jgi:branched-chain amino acid transport system substrate-binding protein